MLLALLLIHLTLALANPFHKYPYVFLLDVGNEELEKVNTEQIRISKSGGSMALRYPAIGYGENIAHVRVSGIDFGTDLKASIVDGGPGYKYVVIVLMGNPGVNFDAVITIQTTPSESDVVGLQNIDNSASNIDYQVPGENDPNDSAEDLSDSEESENPSQISIKKKSELTQESSNVYSYAINEALSGYGSSVHSGSNDDDDNEDQDDEDEGDSSQKDIHIPYRENDIQIETKPEFDDYTNDESPSLTEDDSKELQDSDDYTSVLDYENYSNDAENQNVVQNGAYEEYRNPYNDEDQSSQRFVPVNSETIYIEEPDDNNSPLVLDEIFSDDYDDENSRKYDMNNNNYIDKSDRSAIAY